MSKFKNISKNVNSSSSLESITTFAPSENKEAAKEKKEFKSIILRVPAEAHKLLKHDLSLKHDKNIRDLIIEALTDKYPELKSIFED